MNVISVALASLWDCVSAWHSAQSNHCLQQGARMETWAFRTCLLSTFSVDTERETAGWRTTCCRCEIDLKKERGSHAYNAWHFTLKFSAKQNTELLERTDFLQSRLKAGSWCKSEKNPGKYENQTMHFGAFLERRQMPTVTLDVVPLPPPRIKPHERTRHPFRFSLIF